ncbi:MAG: aminotransferase class I/II-fold pyridoxal phosphate-dependent enzyme [Legionella sp.]|uniref:aminotransferase class I/II-fold pyridoxal phosphate-dependent enzyme n=1 Tax=Legionella sp. TaxID=459 RepID=UPI00284E1BAA|nr:aminotransferase class I/II-fold pyridoxal phosphate-dependent enzyme [Legionella sp.]
MDSHQLLFFISSIVAKELNIRTEDIHPHTNLAEYGLSSIQAITLAGELESKFQADLDYVTLIELQNINNIVDYLVDCMGKKLNSPEVRKKDNASLFLSAEKQLNLFSHTDLYFGQSTGFPNSNITIKKQKYLNFSSYNYLGFAHDSEIINATIEGLKIYGTSASASRLVGGQRTIHRELEQAIAGFLHVEDALVFNSGHSTNVTTIGHLMKSGDLILLDELSHNSLVLGAKLSGATLKFFSHNDVDSLYELLSDYGEHYNKILVVTEGLFSMDGDIAPLNEYVALKEEFDFFLYVDEAHSLGVLGACGGGVGEYYSLDRSLVDVWMGTLSKTMASCGGYIAGSHQLINYLKYTCPGFVYSCALSPADTAAALASIEKLQRESSRVHHLRHLSDYLVDELRKCAINVGLNQGTPIVPIILGSGEMAIRLCNALRKRNIYLHAIVPPVLPDEQSRLRVFLNYDHSFEDINLLVNALKTELNSLCVGNQEEVLPLS